MLDTIAFGRPGAGEWVIIAIIILLLFGKRLPEIVRGVRTLITEFKRGLKGIDDEFGRR